MITNGILNINKPQNMTSHDVVAICRRVLGIKKIGHTGTLDPMATGVLPVCINRSTKIIEYLDTDIKKYSCTMQLGLQTDTQDIWGTEISRNDVETSEEAIKVAFSKFVGIIDQKPPMYSAIKVNGKRLYEYAREGKTVDVKSRKIFIKSIDVEDVDLEGDEKTVTFSVECSKGTYIRTICQDVGNEIGCSATMTRLERTASGIFTIDKAVDIETLRNMSTEEIEPLLYKAEDALDKFGIIKTGEFSGLKFINGNPLPKHKGEIISEPYYADRDFYLPVSDTYRKGYRIFAPVDGEEQFLGIGVFDDDNKHYKADKIFHIRG